MAKVHSEKTGITQATVFVFCMHVPTEHTTVCYTSHEELAGSEKILMVPPSGIDATNHRTTSGHYHGINLGPIVIVHDIKI